MKGGGSSFIREASPLFNSPSDPIYKGRGIKGEGLVNNLYIDFQLIVGVKFATWRK